MRPGLGHAEEGIRLLWCRVINNREVLTPSVSQQGGLLLKGQLQLPVDESTTAKPTNKRQNWFPDTDPGIIHLPELMLPTSRHVAESRMGARPNQMASPPPPPDARQVHAGFTERSLPPKPIEMTVSSRLQGVRLLFSKMSSQGLSPGSLSQSGPLTYHLVRPDQMGALVKAQTLNLPKSPPGPIVLH